MHTHRHVQYMHYVRSQHLKTKHIHHHKQNPLNEPVIFKCCRLVLVANATPRAFPLSSPNPFTVKKTSKFEKNAHPQTCTIHALCKVPTLENQTHPSPQTKHSK